MFNQGQPMIELPVIVLIFFILISVGGGWAITFLWHRHQEEKQAEKNAQSEELPTLPDPLPKYHPHRGCRDPEYCFPLTPFSDGWACRTEFHLDLTRATMTSQTTKETTMQTLDLSPAMIGKTIRVERKNIVGTHNYVEGTLQNFDFDVYDPRSYGYSSAITVQAISLTATISGIELNLTGNETLTIIQ